MLLLSCVQLRGTFDKYTTWRDWIRSLEWFGDVGRENLYFYVMHKSWKAKLNFNSSPCRESQFLLRNFFFWQGWFVAWALLDVSKVELRERIRSIIQMGDCVE